jgi:cation diffusion facilitator CzcD-associated flavoprotein CzcO
MERKIGLVHFIGFRGDEYNRAVRVWGKPDFIHRRWDVRAQQEIEPEDTAVFAVGTCADEPRHPSFDDSEHL